MKVPHCPKCGRDHYNFDGCPGGRLMSPSDQLRRPREELVDVRDRLDTRVVIGGNVYGNRRRPLHSETS